MKKILIIANPNAGKYKKSKILSFRNRLLEHGLDTTIIETRYKGHATQIAKQASNEDAYSHVIAAGGDGTISEVALGLLDTHVILGILPIGTANVLAYEFNVPFDCIQNADQIKLSSVTQIWPGIIENKFGKHLFLQMCSLGFDAHVVHQTNNEQKKLFGKMAYIINALLLLLKRKQYTFQVHINGEIYSAQNLIISKGCFYAGKFKLFNHSEQTRKSFSVMIINKINLITILSIMIGYTSRCSKIKTSVNSEVEISSINRIPMEKDGDECGHSPAHITVSKAPIYISY